MLYGYGVTPLAEDHFEERCRDIVEQVNQGVIYMPLFMMTLVPEGNPVWDKVGPMAALYTRYRDRLAEDGMDCAILVQASLGHGYAITDNPFGKVVRLNSGEEDSVCCPEDEEFLQHFAQVLQTLAALKPKAIMLDDDFRLMMRPGRGCACPRHLQLLREKTGVDMTQQALWQHILTHGDEDPLTVAFRETQTESLVKAARVFRAAIDSVDPTIQGINCTSGVCCESVDKTNPIFAGTGNPTVVRVPNGIYAPAGVRGFSSTMAMATICGKRLKRRGIDIVLAETDTIPYNRYAKSAAYLHAHYTASILEGLQGAKHWLTRSRAYEPDSGKRYRRILGENRGFYEALVSRAKEIRWEGLAHIYTDREGYSFFREPDSYFIHKNLERMGLPFYFSDECGKVNFLEGQVAEMPQAQLEQILEGSVFMTGEAAAELAERGYGAFTGVEVTPWDLGDVSAERFGDGSESCDGQKNPWKITVRDENTRELSWNVRRERNGPKVLAPAVTVKEREDGKLSVVFCGTPNVSFDYMEGFAFLNETRKKQLVSLMKQAGALPVYCHGDAEICLRAGFLADGTLLAALFPLGIDVEEEITLYLEKEPGEIRMLCADGSETAVEWEPLGDSLYKLRAQLLPMHPVILLITTYKR